MAQLGGTKFKAMCGILALTMLASGCGAMEGLHTTFRIDGVRPEVNVSGNMVLFPDEVIDSSGSLTGGSSVVTDEGSSGAGNEGTPGSVIGPGSPDSVIDGDVSDELAEGRLSKRGVCGDDYNTYLLNEVYRKIYELVKDSEVYLKAYSYGVNSVGNAESAIVEYSEPLNSSFSSVHMTGIGGNSFRHLTCEAFRDVLNNEERLAQAVAEAKSTIERAVNDSSIPNPWMLSYESAQQLDLPNSYMRMWSTQKTEVTTLKAFYDLIDSSPEDAIPDLSLKYYAIGYAKYGKDLGVTSSRSPGFTQMKVIDAVTTVYNQYHDNVKPGPVVDFYEEDKYSITYAYIDGFTKTVVTIATRGDYSLKEILLEDYDTVQDIMSSIKNYTEVSDIMSIEGYADVKTVAKNARRKL